VPRDVPSRLRTRIYRGYTRLPDRLRADRRVTAVLQLPAQTGPLQIAGGLGHGLKISPRTLPLTHIQAYGFSRGTLEIGVQEALRRHVRPGSVVYDVGANIGFFSLIAGRLGATVHAFEPVPENVIAIRENAALNDLLIEVHETAVADYDGRSTVSLPDEASWSHLTDLGEHPDATRTIDVAVTTLDAFGGAPDVVKIDVEGYEVEVLKGMTGLLTAARPILIIELHGTRNDIVAKLLTDHRYTLTNLDGPAAIESAGPTHIVAAPG
jgi:FkbM family methyltransferase